MTIWEFFKKNDQEIRHLAVKSLCQPSGFEGGVVKVPHGGVSLCNKIICEDGVLKDIFIWKGTKT